MRLFIAEKPSLARAIAEALPGPQKRTREWIECGPDNVITWCLGHILAPVLPEDYDPKWKVWRLEDLPILPAEWKLQVSAPGPLAAIKKLLKNAARVVHAGDPDREGQLLVDEVLSFLDYRGPVERILISDPTLPAVRRQLEAIEPNTKYRPLSDSALARQRADWLYGMTMTRLYTLLGQRGGYRGVLSVGRVQTPLLGLIARRDAAIEGFRPATYFALSATFKTAAGESFHARWAPGPSAEAHLDDDKRLLNKEFAQAVRWRVEQAGAGIVTACSREKKSEAPPLPYSLADLQIDAAKRLGLSAKEVLDACQRLYETHRLTTYPRSDCAYLPEGQFADAAPVFAAVAKHAPSLAPMAARADRSICSRAWNDKKVTAHHAIVPTANAGHVDLNPTDRAVYDLVARRYLSQFYPAFEYLQSKLEIAIGDERFVASGRQTVSVGWRELTAAAGGAAAESNAEDDDARESSDATLPALGDNASVTMAAFKSAEKQTKPPKPFNDASLMQAMVNIAAFVASPEAKKILTDADGIGTPATRPSIIETLFHRNYVERKGKNVVSTALGRQLVQCLPEVATTPDMTAVWETAMRGITEGTESLTPFLERVRSQIQFLVRQGKAEGKIQVPPSPPAPGEGTAPRSGSRASGKRPGGPRRGRASAL